MLALLQLRTGAANEAQDLLKETLPTVKNVETTKALASLATINVERSVTNIPSEQLAHNEAKSFKQVLDAASLQSLVEPEMNDLRIVTPDYLYKAYDALSKRHPQREFK